MPNRAVLKASLLLSKWSMHATFMQKLIICIVAAFLTASIIQWAVVFIEGADDALNAGYKKDEKTLLSP